MSHEDPSWRPAPEGTDPLRDFQRVHAELELFAQEALARFGAPGTVRVEGGYLVLYAPQGLLRVELGGLAEHWTELGDESRRRRTAELVRRLMSRRSSLPTPPPRRGAPGWIYALVLGAVGFALWAAYAARRSEEGVVRRAAARPEALPEDVAAEKARQERAARVCEAARARVLRGATLGPSETEGWVVDVLLLRAEPGAPLDAQPLLDDFFGPADGQGLRAFRWGEEPQLAELSGPGTGVRLATEQVEGPSGERAHGLRLTFAGRLVDPYFRPEERVRYFHVASALSEGLGATHGGLVARCEGSPTHHVGSWFRGSHPAGAASALLYLMGLYAEPPHLADPFLRPTGGEGLDRAFAYGAITTATAPLDQRALAHLLGKSGGMITTAHSASTITFPFTDGNRASRASREIARFVHLGRP